MAYSCVVRYQEHTAANASAGDTHLPDLLGYQGRTPCLVRTSLYLLVAEHLTNAASCYSEGTMSGTNGDKARFNRVRKHKLALRERSQTIRKELAAAAAPKTQEAPPADTPKH